MTRLRDPIFLALLCGLTLLFPLQGSAQKTKETAGDKAYRILEKEFDESLATFNKAFEAAKTPEARQAALKLRPSAEEYAPKFMALSRRYADSQTALESLTWIVLHPLPTTSKQHNLRTQALDTLVADYPKEAAIGRLCTRLVYNADSETEKFLRAVLVKSTVQGVKARAVASLGHNLKYRARLIRILKDDPAARKEYTNVWGQAAVDDLLKGDPTKMLADAEKQFETVRETYGKIPHPLHGTLAEMARWHLLSIRRPIAVGNLAPNVIGEDINGKKLVLRDYTGKVILIDFWTTYFAPCRVALPYQRNLLTRMQGKPFALIGVNGDADKKAVQKYARTEKMTWPCYFDNGGTAGPMATRWEVDTWPTLILIDHKGIVQAIYEGWPEAKTLETAIDRLVKDAASGK